MRIALAFAAAAAAMLPHTPPDPSPKTADPKILLERRQENWTELASTTDRMIREGNPPNPETYYYNALAHLALNHPDTVEKSARTALKIDPTRFSSAHYLLGIALARKTQMAAAIKELKAYLAAGTVSPEGAKVVERQIREIETLASHLNIPLP